MAMSLPSWAEGQRFGKTLLVLTEYGGRYFDQPEAFRDFVQGEVRREIERVLADLDQDPPGALNQDSFMTASSGGPSSDKSRIFIHSSPTGGLKSSHILSGMSCDNGCVEHSVEIFEC